MPSSPQSSTPTAGSAGPELREPDLDTTELALGTGKAELVATNSGELIRAWGKRIKHGESGVLPVVAGLVVIVIIFQTKNSLFLSAGNITNLLIQSTTYVLLGMAEVFVLLLGEIDLSIGYVAAVGAVCTVALTSPKSGWPWWAACLAGIAVTSAIGAVQGLLITRLRIPSFVVTLAGLLGFEGVLIYLANREGGKTGGGVVSISDKTLSDLVNGELSPAAGWTVLIVAVVLFAALVLLRDRRLRASGLVAAPRAVAYAKIAVVAAAGVILVAVCNTNRGNLIAVRGVPWAVPIVLVVVLMWTFLLGRTRFGRYVYAVGGNAEAARRAGVSLNRIRLLAFTLAGFTSGIAGILYASRLGSISNNVDGGSLVLYAVAAAVIGGTSLTGGRGKMVHALLGGVVVAAIYNGMGLIGLSAAAQDMVIALVLLGAVTVDAVARRGRTAG